MQRRKFIRLGSMLLGAFPLMQTITPDTLNMSFLDENDVVRIRIGKIECTLFRDMMFKYLAKDFFINANEEELSRSLTRYHITPDNIPSPFIAILLQYDDKKILIDTGVGYSEKPVMVRGTAVLFQGKLTQLLQQEQVAKEDITDVIVTHFHPDHIGGIFGDDGMLNYPNARFYMHEEEWNYWHSSRSDNQPDQFKYFIGKNITRLKDGNLHLVKGDLTELMAGVTAVKADGHTPGQLALIIESGKEHLLYISDAFLHPLHIERVDWKTNYDLDQEKAKQSRTRLLELAYKNNMLVNIFHFDFPGLGRVVRSGNTWLWKTGTT